MTTEGPVLGGTAMIVFDDQTQVDFDFHATITVSDDIAGPLGTVSATDAPKTFSYTLYVGPYGFGGFTFVNTASCVSGLATGSDSSGSRRRRSRTPGRCGAAESRSRPSSSGPNSSATRWLRAPRVDFGAATARAFRDTVHREWFAR